jgi:hypothetical protein
MEPWSLGVLCAQRGAVVDYDSRRIKFPGRVACGVDARARDCLVDLRGLAANVRLRARSPDAGCAVFISGVKRRNSGAKGRGNSPRVVLDAVHS